MNKVHSDNIVMKYFLYFVCVLLVVW